MRKTYILLLTLLIPFLGFTQNSWINIQYLSDNYPSEISWILYSGGQIVDQAIQGDYDYADANQTFSYTYCVYPFGIDPAWMMSENDLTFYNSFKMKTSVIIGVFHMLIGIIIKGCNAVYFDRKLDFIHEFIP